MAVHVEPGQYITRQPVSQGYAANPFNDFNSEWSVGICSCFDDCGECMYAYFCTCCFICSLAKNINEDSCSSCCIPNRLSIYRMKVRSVLKIRGSALNDCCATSWCGICAAIQMKLELKRRGLA